MVKTRLIAILPTSENMNVMQAVKGQPQFLMYKRTVQWTEYLMVENWEFRHEVRILQRAAGDRVEKLVWTSGSG